VKSATVPEIPIPYISKWLESLRELKYFSQVQRFSTEQFVHVHTLDVFIGNNVSMNDIYCAFPNVIHFH
jgi:hypothetical protein